MHLVLTLALISLIAGCGGRDAQQTSLSALAAAQQDFDGRQVIVSGTLRTFAEPRHYWIENDKLDRVALEGGDNLAGRVGDVVEVHGRFHYDRREGRRLFVTKLVDIP
jgi:hypothetical protein